MALLLRKCLLEGIPVLHQVKRFRGKINLKRPQYVHFERAVIMHLTKPWFKKRERPPTAAERCKGFLEEKRTEEENPLQKFLAQSLYKQISESKLVVFYHLNPMDGDDQFKAYAMFYKQNMLFKQYGKKTMEMAIKGTPYETILDFYCSQNITTFCREPDINTVLKITKKFPQIVLLAAIFEGRLISRDELIKYSAIPNLTAAQAGLVQTLNSLGGNLIDHLNKHQNSLVSNLEARAKQLQEQET